MEEVNEYATKRLQILELFSGFASWTKPFKEDGHEIITLDYNCKFKPTICEDVLKWDYKNSSLKPDIIFASPDCTYFSIARVRWGYPEDKLDWTKSLWLKTFEIIGYFKPDFYLIENPRGKARKYFPVGYKNLDYCMYNYKIGDYWIKKPTDLWTNIPMEFKKCDKSHIHTGGADKKLTNFTKIIRDKAKRAIVPDDLTREVKRAIYNANTELVRTD